MHTISYAYDHLLSNSPIPLSVAFSLWHCKVMANVSKVERDNVNRQHDSVGDADIRPMELAVSSCECHAESGKTDAPSAELLERLLNSANGTNTEGLMEVV